MSRQHAPRFASFLLSSLSTAAFCQGQAPIRLGSEFQVNSYTVNDQLFVVMAGDGDFLVAWQSLQQDGAGGGVFARRFSATGTPQAAEFQVNSYTTSGELRPAVGMDGDGDFVIAWEGNIQDGSDFGIFGRRFNAAGVAQAVEFQVNTHITNAQRYPALALDADGDFVVAWNSYQQDGSSYGIFARRFDSSGVAQGDEFQVNSVTMNDQRRPAVALDADGDFVVAWTSYGPIGDSGVFARRFSAAGVAQATEFQVNSYNTSYQSSAAVAMESGGDFVVVWTSDFQDGFGSGIFARRFSSAGVSVAAEFQVNSYTSSSQHLLALAIDADGDFVVAWNSYGQDGYGGGVFSKLFTAAGIPVTADFQVSLQTANKQFRTAVTLDGDGDFVVAWDGYDGPFNFGIFAQRFATLLALEIDGDGSIGALTDGLLVLRYLFGFTGSALAVGAVSGGCTRCSPTEIKDYLDSIASELDVDGNGSAAALTDGLLILRYLFGFTGATLVSDAIDVVGCSRCDPTAIESYLQTQL